MQEEVKERLFFLRYTVLILISQVLFIAALHNLKFKFKCILQSLDDKCAQTKHGFKKWFTSFLKCLTKIIFTHVAMT